MVLEQVYPAQDGTKCLVRWGAGGMRLFLIGLEELLCVLAPALVVGAALVLYRGIEQWLNL